MGGMGIELPARLSAFPHLSLCLFLVGLAPDLKTSSSMAGKDEPKQKGLEQTYYWGPEHQELSREAPQSLPDVAIAKVSI